jgi:hypothetical protein
MTFETAERRELIRITEEVQAAVDEARGRRLPPSPWRRGQSSTGVGASAS